MQSPPIGSDFYYALRFSGKGASALAPLWAYVQTIKAIRTPTLDESIVPIKLKWWMDEIERTYQGTPQHPLMQTLWPHIQTQGLSEQLFLNIIEAQALLVTQPNTNTWSDFQTLADTLQGSEIQLYSQSLATPNPMPESFCRYLSLALFIIDKIANFGHDVKNGELFFPAADLTACHITPTALLNQSCEPQKMVALLQKQCNRAKEATKKALNSITGEMRFQQLPLINLLRLKAQLLIAIEETDFDVFNHTYRLTPITQCWIAWQSYRKEKKMESTWKSCP